MPSNELGDLIGRYEGGPHDPYNISNDGTGRGSHHEFSESLPFLNSEGGRHWQSGATDAMR
jgi:hypothetical protein